MADYSAITIQGNSNTDAAPTWTGTAMVFGGSAGANELRFSDTGAGATNTTASASWPPTLRPLVTPAAVREAYIFATDAGGFKVATYDGTRTKANVFRLNHSADGTLASAERFSSFANNTLPAPSPGTQVNLPTDGANIVNGQATDTNSQSYLYGNFYGSGLTAAGVQETPAAGNVGTTLTCGVHSAVGAATPAAASWLATWQDLQGWVDWIVAPAIAKPVTAFFWYFTMCLFMGPNELPGSMPFCPLILDYTWT